MARELLVRTTAFTKNHDHVKHGYTPCARCGRGIKDGTESFFIRIVGGGNQIGTPDELEPDMSDCGYWPVGSECAFHIPKGFLVGTDFQLVEL